MYLRRYQKLKTLNYYNLFAKSRALYIDAFRGLSPQIWLLSVVMLINRCGTMVLAFMTLYCISLGYSLKEGGIVVGIYGLGSVTGALLGGKLTDKFGFYSIQFLALFCGGILFLVLGQMHDYGLICLFTFILAMVNETFRPANSTAIAHYSKLENRTQSVALVRLAINLGWGVGIALGGFLAATNYSLLFWVDGFTNIVAGIALVILLPKVSLFTQKDPGPVQGEVPAISSPYKDKPFLFFLLFQLLFAICFFQLFTTIPVFFKEGLKLSEFTIGAVMAINGVLIAVFEMVIVFKLEKRKPYLVLMSYGSVLMALSFFMLMLPTAWGIYIAIIAMLVVTCAEMIAMPFMNSYYLARTTQVNRGRYAGLYTMTWSLAQMAGSVSGTFVAEKLGFVGLWFLVGILSACAAIGYFGLYRKTEFKGLVGRVGRVG